ncbi:response regulator receiver protein [Caballeronia temeraria]|uniref:Response regulator receiver protein n=1 Tax=Caballeronia temeraria TaxID=1777137 RepID=A0A158AFS6_9BURK|nr:response regulator [Caballeronia temeraria]SAK56570.1 response regulator receiver protein [Caballeronia temeraria]
MSLLSTTARWTSRALIEPEAGRRRRLLVVDDFQPGAEATTALLSTSGYDARFVVDGAAAFPLVIAWVPDSVVLDINMPGMDGYAVARQLRQDARLQHVVIIAFTSQEESATRLPGIEAGFDAYCRKDARPDQLLRLLALIAGETGT